MNSVIPSDPNGAFIVWGPKGTTNIKKRYSTHEQACEVGKKMADTHLGETFYVAEILTVHTSARPNPLKDFMDRWGLDNVTMAGELGLSVDGVRSHIRQCLPLSTMMKLALEALENRYDSVGIKPLTSILP